MSLDTGANKMAFRTRIEEIARKHKSNVVLALDFPFEDPRNRNALFEKSENVLDAASPYLCAVKFNNHLVLPLGVFDGVQNLIAKAHDLGLPTIMDCKINDIGTTNQVIAEYYYAAGFDALIANPFIGWEEGMQPIFEVAKKRDRGVILLVYMSHKGASQGYGQTVTDPRTGDKIPQYMLFARTALKLKADGAVVGATYPEKIKQVHEMLCNEVPIYSPGIGVQGGDKQSAIKAGTRYAIVGRAITESSDPAEAAREFSLL